MSLPDDLPIQHFHNDKEWEQWLSDHSGSKGLWLKIAKKDSGIASVNYAQALDVALCHGWIDGQKKGLDAQFFLQRMHFFVDVQRRAIAGLSQLLDFGFQIGDGLFEVEVIRIHKLISLS